MRVLVGCESSGVVREAFGRRGHHAWSCDLLPAEDASPYHIQDDVLNVVQLHQWDLFIVHPTCTYLCNSGVRWLHERPERWAKLDEACRFVRDLLASEPPTALENPLPHRHALQRIGRSYDQRIQPWQFGHGETKQTCLWLDRLPPLKPTKVVDGRYGRCHRESPGPDRWKRRSRAYTGIAEAMAEQWAG